MDFFDEPDLDTQNVEYPEIDAFDTSEQYDFEVSANKRAKERTKLQLSDFYSDEPQSNKDLLWKYLIYVNLLRKKDMNYLEYYEQCKDKFRDSLEHAKMQIIKSMVNQTLEVDDLDAFFDELEGEIDKFAAKCFECLDHKINSSSIQITDKLYGYGPVVVSALSQLKTLTIRIRESKRKKLAKCTGKLLETIKQVGIVICDSRNGDFKHKTFDLVANIDDMNGRNDFFMQYRSNLILRYFKERDLILEFLNSSIAESITIDPEFNFSSDFLHLIPARASFHENFTHDGEFSRETTKIQSPGHDDFDTDKQQPESPPFEFTEIDTDQSKQQETLDEKQMSEVDEKALELARSKAAAILKKKRELQRKIQLQNESSN